ncbi:hypothetical protein Ddc_10323 [Ditylenchus destructor]|nr:hypothetical protein Ddc_10323 [Ditylenchus destructor]
MNFKTCQILSLSLVCFSGLVCAGFLNLGGIEAKSRLEAITEMSGGYCDPIASACGQSLGCCECVSKCLVDYYRCLKPCDGDKNCVIRCTNENFMCSENCLIPKI